MEEEGNGNARRCWMSDRRDSTAAELWFRADYDSFIDVFLILSIYLIRRGECVPSSGRLRTEIQTSEV